MFFLYGIYGIDIDFICSFLEGILMELIWILFFCMEFMEYGFYMFFFVWNLWN